MYLSFHRTKQHFQEGREERAASAKASREPQAGSEVGKEGSCQRVSESSGQLLRSLLSPWENSAFLAEYTV